MFRLGDTWVVPTNIVTITDLHIEEEKFETNPDYYKRIAKGKINGMLAEKTISRDKFTFQEEWELQEAEFKEFCFQYNDLLDWCKRRL